MTDIMPSRPPLREAIAEACANHPYGVVDLKPAVIDAVILAFRDWLTPTVSVPDDESEFARVFDGDLEWQYSQRLRDILTAEAERAESGE